MRVGKRGREWSEIGRGVRVGCKGESWVGGCKVWKWSERVW